MKVLDDVNDALIIDTTPETSDSKSNSTVLIKDDSGKSKKIKKRTLCWLLQQSQCNLSSDRLRRVMGK